MLSIKLCPSPTFNSTGIQTAIIKTDKQIVKHQGSRYIWRLALWWHVCADDRPSLEISHEHADGQTDRWPALKHTALITVSGAASWSPLQFPALCSVMMWVWVVPLWPVPWLLQLDVIRPLTALRHHLEVGSNTVVLRHRAAEVNDTTLIRALIWWLDARETELVGDVAADHFYHLVGTKNSVFSFKGTWKTWDKLFFQHNEAPIHEWKYAFAK